MNSTGKRFRMFLTAPIHSIRVSIGHSFPVSVRVQANDVELCEIHLQYDPAVFDETTGQPNPHQLHGRNLDKEIGWWLQACRESPASDVVLNGRANGSLQQSFFQVEVTQ